MRISRPVIIAAIKITLTAAILYIISLKVNLNPLSYLNSENTIYFYTAGTCALILVFLQALRWKYVTGIFSLHLSYKQCLWAVWSGHLINNLLPAATAGDLLRSYTLKQVNADQRKWTWMGAFLSEKYSAAISALFLACISLTTSIYHQLPIMLMGLIILLFSGSLIFPLFINYLINKPSLQYLQNNKLLDMLSKLSRQLANTFLHNKGRQAFIISTLINSGMCIIFFTIALALRAPISFAQCLFVVPVFTLLTSLPISYAGWGIRELSCVGLLKFFGCATDIAIAISVLYGLIFLLSCLPGIFACYPFLFQRNLQQSSI